MQTNMTTDNPSNRQSVQPGLPHSSEKKESPEELVDTIASYYILTMDFVSLNKLLEKQYCDDLIVLTADIMKAHLTNAEIEYLEQKIVNGVPKEEIVKKEVVFFKQGDINKMDIPDPVNKQRACIGIAKYYIKIAHLFASIVMTLNPVYSYLDKLGNTVKVPLYKKDSLPKGVDVALEEYGICGERIRALRSDNKYDGLHVGDAIKVNPNVCAMNKKMDGTTKTLVDEPGIPELMHLYYDDKYDFKKGVFTGMSTETQKEYENNVREFYVQFTGNKEVPESIKEFRDIKLKDYSKLPQCGTNIRNAGQYTSELKTDSTERYTLFSKYAQHVQNMMLNANKNQEKLVQIINQLFEKQPDSSIRIHRDLNETKLQQLVVETRKLIIELYLKCEMDYQEGLNIYEAIVQSSIVKTTDKQLRELTLMKEKYAKALNVPASSITPIAKNSEAVNGSKVEDVNKEEKPDSKEEKSGEKDNKDNKKDKVNADDKDIQVQYISLDNTNPPKEVLMESNEQINLYLGDSKEEKGIPNTVSINNEKLMMGLDNGIDKSDPKYAEQKYLLEGEKEEKQDL